MRPYFSATIVFVLSLVLAGCEKDDKIVIYTTPKDATQPSQQSMPDAMPAPTDAAPIVAASSSGANGATWTTPPGWKQETPKPMCVANFTAGQSELLITQFAQDNIGGLLPNINRWRGMVGLDPASDPNSVPSQQVKVSGNDGTLFDFTGPEQNGAAKRVLIAMIPDGANYWFFRMQGPAAGIAEQLPAFNSFLQSVKFSRQSK